MKRILIAAILFLFTLTNLHADNPTLTAKLRQSVGILYSQGFQGELQMRCTATAFEETPTGYEFATAAHCIGDDNKSKERSATGEDIPFYITKDESGLVKTYHRAEVKWAGYQSRGEDFVVFKVTAPTGTWKTIPLGDETQEAVGDPITNIASPLGLGFQIFHGSITSLNLDRPVVDSQGINWKGSILLNIQSGPGSSGSALVSQKSENIIGFLIGAIGGNNIVGVPISRFKAVKKAVEAGKYKYWQPEAELNPDGTAVK